MTPQELEQYVQLAADASNLQNQQQANSLLLQWVSSSTDTAIADILLSVLKATQKEVVLFYCLTTFHRLSQTTIEQRAAFRRELLSQLLGNGSCWSPVYLRTKVGVLLTRFIQLDFPHAWPNAFSELQDPSLLQAAPDIFLRTLVALTEEFGKDETEVNTKIKDLLRGFTVNRHQQNQQRQQEPSQPSVPPVQSMSGQLMATVLPMLGQSLGAATNTNLNTQEALSIAILCLSVIRGFMSWVDLSLLLDETTLSLLFSSLSQSATRDSIVADAGVTAMECLQELIGRGMDDDKKIAVLVRTGALEQINANVNLMVVDESPIDVVMEVAKFINLTGLEVVPMFSQQQKQENHPIYVQILELFFRCYAYDDIDVSGAVIPLAGLLVSSHEKEPLQEQVFAQLLAVTYRQMRYPADFQYDHEDDEEAEEEMYRIELRKLNQKFVRAAPEACLQFLCQTLSQLPMPLSSALTPDIEAALRLVYHYCEGIRPPPGLKVVMKNETFRNLLVGLHSSDITLHSHEEVIILYYDTSVRYYPLLKDQPELLQLLLDALTGNRGLQHSSSRVRSRCCYMLLRLIRSIGKGKATNSSVLLPYVDKAIAGILQLLETSSGQLRIDDILNLFETIGLLLGKTGLDPAKQQTLLTQVMTPHVRSIERVLEQGQAIAQNPDAHGEILAGSIAAIAYLSKGFKNPSEGIQMVLVEALKINVAVLEALPFNEEVRNKTYIFVQRMILCLEDKILPSMPRIMSLVITHCTSEDILDVAQLFNQLCIKYKSNAVPVLDAGLLPFLQKCQTLSTISTAAPTSGDGVAPHLRTEQLSIHKLTYASMQHVAAYRVEAIFFTPTNSASFESILNSMQDGAIHAEDPLMKKTCIVFFKDLLENWMLSNGNGASNGGSVVVTHPPQVVVEGYVRFITNSLISGVVASFLEEKFNCDDANQWRSVSEFAAILQVLRERLPDLYLQEVLIAKFTNTFRFSPAVVENFRLVTNRKQMETALKTMIKTPR
mmetsp:Transcript_1749/g.3879  ORF Transcript_1749/g.3879 Transcript_1749/m.3879 type:complete len:1001 (-) Transcript_1749:62-3064(-)